MSAATEPSGASSAEERQSRPLATKAAVGLKWMAGQSVLSKVITVATQLVIARLLAPQDFGLFTLAFTVTTVISAMQFLGFREVLIQRRATIEEWTNPSFWISILSGTIGALMVIALAAPAAHVYRQPQLFGLLMAASVGAFFNPMPLIPTAVLQARMQFRVLSLLSLVHMVVISGLSIVFARMGWGALSFIWARNIAHMVRLVLGQYFARAPLKLFPELHKWPHLLGDNFMLLLARLAATMVGQGDYMVLGLFRSEAVVGIYYFAFSLSMQTIYLLSDNLAGVVLPALSALQPSPERQRSAFVASTRLLAFIVMPACFIQAIIARPFIELLFPSKWYSAAPVLSALSIGMAFRSIGYSAQSLLEAQGRFRAIMWSRVAVMGSFFAAVVYGARYGGATAVGIAAAACFIVETLLLLRIALGRNGFARTTADILLPSTLAGVCGVGFAYGLWIPLQHVLHGNLVRVAFFSAFSCIGYGAAITLIAPSMWRELASAASMAMGRLHRARSLPALAAAGATTGANQQAHSHSNSESHDLETRSIRSGDITDESGSADESEVMRHFHEPGNRITPANRVGPSKGVIGHLARS